MTQETSRKLHDALLQRFADTPATSLQAPLAELLISMAQRGSCRDFKDEPVPAELLDFLCAVALASPTKSDLQQRDIVLLKSSRQRARLTELVSGQAWVSGAPMLVVFCGNNRRQRLLHDWYDIKFANDHLDALINATADAAIALGAFVTAAEALGLGCCPISAVRNEAEAVSDLLGLPSHVFPFAGLALGFPAHPPQISKRLPLKATCHVDRYQEENLQNAVREYDNARRAAQPHQTQRFVDQFGTSHDYGWSEDKVRQYSKPERADFGQFIRRKGFCLD